MSRRFGEVSTDALRGPNSGVFSGKHSFSIWTYRLGDGGGSGGYVGLRHQYALEKFGTDFQIFRGFVTTNGIWRFSIPSTNAWHNIIVTYTDNAADNPIAYVDGLSVTVTEALGPVGAAEKMGEIICLGNKVDDNAQNFDGYLAEFAFWQNRILSPVEAYQIGRAKKSALFFRNSLFCYAPLDNGKTIYEKDVIFPPSYFIDTFPKLRSIDQFDSYSTGSALGTLNDGRAWTSAWTASAAGKTIETSPAGGQGGNAVRQLTTTQNNHTRDFTAITEGVISWRMRLSITNPNDFMGVIVRESTNAKMFVKFDDSGNIQLFDNDISDYETIQSYSVDTWYFCELQFDNVGQPNMYRVRIDGGTWTSWREVNGGTYTNISRIDLDTSATNAHTMWYDDVQINVPSTRPTTVLDTLDIVRPSTVFFNAVSNKLRRWILGHT